MTDRDNSLLSNRPLRNCTPATGPLQAEHFQMAYVTNDMDRACDLFTAQFGIREFCHLEGPMPSGGYMRAAFAWVGTIMYELLSSSGEGSALYMDRLPDGGAFAIRHHHLGFLVHDQAQLDGVVSLAEAHGWAVPYRNTNAFVQVAFVEPPALGHYLEYLLPTEAGLAFFENVPRT